MNEHRVSMFSSILRRHEDPEQSRDQRVRDLVEALKAVDYAPAPEPRFRAELRAQLVAVAPRIIAESNREASAAAEAGSAARPTTVRAGHELGRARRRRLNHPIGVAAGLAAAFLMLFGGAVWESQKSLPGDSLYGLKRASENVQLDLSSGGTDRGHEYLKLAQTRVDEAQALLHRDSASAAGAGPLAGGLSTETATLISANLSSADADVRHGSDLLDSQAVTSRSTSPLSVITSWAPGQLDRLHELAASLPQGSLQNRTTDSLTLTSSALARARSLVAAVAGGCASTSKTDALGPVPTCTAGAGTGSRTPSPRTSAAPGKPATGSGGSIGSTTTRRPARGAATTDRPSSAAPSRTAPSTPALPSRLPSLPVSVGSCGISVSVGPIGIGVGGCPSHS